MLVLFFFKQKTAYEMRISDWSSDVCSSDLVKGDGRIETLQGGGLARAVEPLQQGGDVGVRGDRLGEHDVAAPALALQARRHVHRGAEVVQPPVEGDGDARPLVHAELDGQGARLGGIEGRQLALDVERDRKRVV